MSRISIIATIFLLPLFSRAQYSTSQQKWGISFTPAIVRTPVIQYAVQPGVEYRINDRFILLTDFAFAIGPRNNDSSALNRKYFRIKPELKYMMPHGSRRFHEYLSLQLSYSFRSFRHGDKGSYFNDSNRDTIATAFNSADVRSPISTASVLYGIDIWPFKQCFIEMFAGMGIRNINTHYRNVVNAHTIRNYQPLDKSFPTFDNAEDINGSVFRFHPTLGLRLVYRFNNQ